MHFWISAALTAHAGAETAEQIGIAKELLDARGRSGFSFSDLAADFAGVALAKQALAGDAESSQRFLGRLGEAFRGDRYLPAVEDLEEGISMDRFLEKYGGVKDPRFLQACDAIRARVGKSPGLSQPPKESRPKK